MDDAFCLTPDLRVHLAALTAALAHGVGVGAFVVGAYGSGKSHLLTWLARRVRQGAIVPNPPEVVTVSLLDWPATSRLEDIVCGALALPAGDGDRRARFATWRRAHPRGALLLLDELSEFLRSKADRAAFNEDVRTLQFLGEWALDGPLWIVAAMQEQIEHTGQIEHELYRKIRDRYPLLLPLTASHVRELLATSVLVKGPGYEDAVAKLITSLRRSLPRVPTDRTLIDFAALQEIYPLHPATLELLDEVRDRFSRARGAVDFACVQLRGDVTRGVEPFLDRPWGELLTPDRIVVHFQALLELQADFQPVAQRVMPYWRDRIPELFPQQGLQTLAWQLLRLLVVCWLSPRREGLDAAEATAWLLFAPSQIDPAQNALIIQKTLDRLASEGRYVSKAGPRFALAPGDDGAAELDRAMGRAIADVMVDGPALWEAVLPHLPELPEIFSQARDTWQVRIVRWHQHDRRIAIWHGNGLPSTPPVEPSLVVRLPWSSPTAPGYATVLPDAPPAGPSLKEILALARLLERAWRPAQEAVLRQRLTDRTVRAAQDLSTACRAARFLDPSGTAVPPVHGGLDAYGERLLRLRFPKFEAVAPTWTALPAAAWQAWMRAGGEVDAADVEGAKWLRLVRDGFLGPMGILRREGGVLVAAEPLERVELVRVLLPLCSVEPEPSAVYASLAAPPWGLVPDQVTALLAFLVVRGELDVTRTGPDGTHSWRTAADTLPSPLQYARIVAGSGLDAEALRGLDELTKLLVIPRPKTWTAAAQGAAVAGISRRVQETAARFAALDFGGLELDPTADVEALYTAEGLLTPGDARGGFEELLHRLGPAARLGARLVGARELVDRLEHQLPELRRLLAAGVTAGADATPRLTDGGAVEAWLTSARQRQTEQATRYRQAHDALWATLSADPVWDWSPPPAASLAAAGLGKERAAYQARRARLIRCVARLTPEQGRCGCGFDGETAPAAAEIAALAEMRKRLEEELTAIFAQGAVRDSLREALQLGVVAPSELRPWLDRQVAWPEVSDVQALDAHLAGVQVVSNLPAGKVLDRLVGRTWTKDELGVAFAELVAELPGDRIRVTAGDDLAVVRWANRVALRYGEPLPGALRGRGALGDLIPDDVSPAALCTLDTLGLSDEVIDRVLGFIADGLLTAAPTASAIVQAAAELSIAATPTTPEGLAEAAARLYGCHDRLLRVAPARWLDRLEALATTGIEAPALPLVLKDHLDRQWWVVDALGLPLWPAVRLALGEILPGWKVQSVTFAKSSAVSTTAAFQDGLLAHVPRQPFVKTDSIDALLHERWSPFPDMSRMAIAELIGAGRRIAKGLDPARELVLFADHGFRLSRDGRRYVHGGPSTLERLVPVVVLSVV